MAVLKNSSSQTNWPLIGGIVVVVIIIIVVAVVVFKKGKSTPAPEKEKAGGQGQGKISLNEIKDKVSEFQAGNAAAFKGADISCYAEILFDNQDNLNIDAEKIYDILDSGGLKFDNYQPGLLSSISIVSKALKDAKPKPCEVFEPLTTTTKFKVAAAGTVFNSAGLEKVFKTGKDPVGEPYTEFSFLTFVYFLSNLYKEGKANSIYSPWDSNNLKRLNEQLIEAKAFNSNTTPVEGGSSTVVSTPTTTININITTPGGEVVTTKSPDGGDFDFGGGGGGDGDFSWGGDETTSTTTTTTTRKPTTTPMSLQDALQKKFAPYVAGKIKDYLLEKIKSVFPSGFEKLGETGQALVSIISGVALTKVLQEGVKFIVGKLGSGGIMNLTTLGQKLNLGPNGYDEIWNTIKGGGSWTELFKNTVSMFIKNIINETVVKFIMDKAVGPAIDGIKKGVVSIPFGVGSAVEPYADEFAEKAKNMILKILSNLAGKLGTWAADLALTAADKLKSFFTDFMSSPITALKNLKSNATGAMSGFTWSALWSQIRQGIASVLKEIVQSVLEETGLIDAIGASNIKVVYDKIDSIIGGASKEPYMRNYRINDRRAEYMVNNIAGVAEAYLDIHGFNKAISKEEFSYLRPQLSRFANTQEFFTIMY